MTDKQLLVLYGNSVLLAGLALNLQNHFCIRKVVYFAEIQQLLKLEKPVAIVIDSTVAYRDSQAILVESYPEVPIIELTPQDSTTLVYSCHKESVTNVQDLQDIILKYSDLEAVSKETIEEPTQILRR